MSCSVVASKKILKQILEAVVVKPSTLCVICGAQKIKCVPVIKEEILQLQKLKAAIESDPRKAQEIPDWVKKLRQHNFKFEYKKRQNKKKFTSS